MTVRREPVNNHSKDHDDSKNGKERVVGFALRTILHVLGLRLHRDVSVGTKDADAFCGGRMNALATLLVTTGIVASSTLPNIILASTPHIGGKTEPTKVEYFSGNTLIATLLQQVISLPHPQVQRLPIRIFDAQWVCTPI